MSTMRKVFASSVAGLAVTGGALAFTGKPEITDRAKEECAESLRTYPENSRRVPKACYGPTLRAFVDIETVGPRTMPTPEDFLDRAQEIQDEDDTYRVIHTLASIGLGFVIGGVVFVELNRPVELEQ